MTSKKRIPRITERALRLALIASLFIPQTKLAWAASTATRTLPASYTAGSPVSVSVAVTPDALTLAYAVEDAPPAGWVVSSIDTSGAWDAVNGKVKWGPFFDNTPRTLSYVATPPTGTTGTKTFTGTASFDGTTNLTIGGASSIGSVVANTAPTANAKSVTTNEDTAASIVLTATDPDTSQTLTYSVVTQPTKGVLSGTAPNLTYTPNTNVNGSDSFTFKVNDGIVDSNIATVSITITPVNDAPTANAQSVQTNMNIAKAITLTGADVDGDALTYSVVTGPTHGTLSGTAPNLTYTPTTNYSGSDSFTFKTSDGVLSSVAATISISVINNNTAPTANAKSVTTNEDTAASIVLTATDPDTSQTLTYSVVTQPTKGVLSGTAPNLTYTPNTNVNGSDSFTFKVNDGIVDSNIATVSITITPVNDAPTANAQSVQTNMNIAKAITLTGADVDGDALTYSVVTGPTHGTLSGTAPNLTYTPATNYSGSDSFTFKTSDGVLSSVAATISITVINNNTPPTANAKSVTTNEDTAVSIVLTGSDPDLGQTLTYTVVTQPTKGVLSGTAPNLTYTPNANVNGADSFTFKVNDGLADSSVATVSITITPVNDAPLANSQSVQTNLNTAKAITLTGSDVDGDALTYSVVTSPTHGTLSGTAPNLTYTPTTNYSGSDSFTFKTSDGLLTSGAATVGITVTNSNTAPTANAKTVTTNEDTAASIVLSATDPDLGQTLTYTIVTQPTKGVLSGTAPNLTYTPNANVNGSDSFTFKVNDGITDSNTAAVSITITPVNDAPTANSQSVQTNMNVAKAITLSGADVDGDALTFSVVTGPTHGTLSGTAPNLTYTPTTNFSGSDSFTFKSSDGLLSSVAATVSIGVINNNTAPTANAKTVTTNEDTAASIVLTATDPDGGQTLSYTIVTQPTKGILSGTAPNLTYTPNANVNGSDSFTFKANDGLTDSNVATVSISITPVNDAPSANAQSVQTNMNVAKAITLTGSDVDGDSLTYSVVSNPLHGTLSGTAPSLLYTPAKDYFGSDSFTFKSSDGLLASPVATISINVVNTNTVTGNTAPTANSKSVTTNEDTAVAVVLTATDPDLGQTLTYTVISQPSKGVLSGTAPNLTYTPNVNVNGSDTFTFKANDGIDDSNVATVSISITPVNDAPTASSQSVQTTMNVAKAITLTGSDIDGDSLSFSIVVAPSHGTLSGTPPALTYTPASNYTGTDSFSFVTNDGKLTSSPASVAVNIIASGVNQKPVVSAGADINLTDKMYTALQGSASDDGIAQPLTYVWTMVSGPASVAFDDATNPSTTVHFTQFGAYVLRLTANDGLTTASSDVHVTLTQTTPSADAVSSPEGFAAFDPVLRYSKTKSLAIEFDVAGNNAAAKSSAVALAASPSTGVKHVQLLLYDRKGERVASLTDADLPAGHYSIEWNAANSEAKTVASGSYIAVLKIDGVTQKRKVVVIK